MSIEKDIRFIAESIEWQNKLLASIFLNKDSDDSKATAAAKLAEKLNANFSDKSAGISISYDSEK